MRVVSYFQEYELGCREGVIVQFEASIDYKFSVIDVRKAERHGPDKARTIEYR